MTDQTTDSAELDAFRAAAALHERGASYVLVTVVRVQGSTPRNPGAKMVWHRDGTANGRWIGTVGGGQFERLVQDDAEKHLRAGSCGVERYVLGSDADQCCGGVMEVFFEAHGPRQRVVVFGAGHVGFELAKLLVAAPFEVVMVDDRPEWNTPERFPRSRRLLAYDHGIA